MPRHEISYKQKIFNACGLSKHKLFVDGNRIKCLHCLASVSIHGKHVFDFMSSACIPKDKYMSYSIGNWHTHPSHDIVLYGGVFLCVKCGSTALNKIQNLKDVCYGNEGFGDPLTPQSHGESNIKRYKKGKAPLGYPDWPYNKYDISDETVMKNIRGQLNGIAHEIVAPPSPEQDSEVESLSSTTEEALSSSGDSSSSWD